MEWWLRLGMKKIREWVLCKWEKEGGEEEIKTRMKKRSESKEEKCVGDWEKKSERGRSE